MIINAKAKTVISFSNLPNMSSTITSWSQKLVIKKITKELIDYKIEETESTISIDGVMQPLDPQKLEMKAEGQRAWAWQMLHTTYNFAMDDKLLFLNVPYRVLEKINYSQYGYIEYHLAQDYTC